MGRHIRKSKDLWESKDLDMDLWYSIILNLYLSAIINVYTILDIQLKPIHFFHRESRDLDTEIRNYSTSILGEKNLGT